MRTLIASCLLSLAGTVAAAEQAPEQAAAKKSGCEAYTWNLAREFNLLRVAPLSAPTSIAADPEARPIPLDRRVDLTLHPAPQVSLAAASPPDAGVANAYAGIVRLSVPRLATYRISTDTSLSIDVLGADGPIKPRKFEAQPDCAQLRKVVAFRLDGPEDYTLQLSGSPSESLAVVITLDR